MVELSPGLWHWQAPHPQWAPTEPWDANVSSYAIDDRERLLLFDPLGVPSERAAIPLRIIARMMSVPRESQLPRA